MYKKINVFLIGCFSILTIYTKIGYMLYIPLLFYYLIRNIKNIYIFTISGITSLILSFLNNIENIQKLLISILVPFLLLMIIMYLVIWILNKISKSYFVYLFIVIINIFMQFIYFKGIDELLPFLIYLGISCLLYLFLEKNLIDSISPNNNFYNNAYVSIIISVIAIVGAAQFKLFNINLGIIVGIYFSMYFGMNYKNIYSTLYALISTFILMFIYKELDALLILVISSFYISKFSYPIILTTLFSTMMIFIPTNFNQELLLSIMVVSIIFEVLKRFLIKDQLSDELVISKLYSQITSNITNEVLGFASFLDKFIMNFKDSNEYNKLIHNSIQTMMNNCCQQCSQFKECKSYFKSNLYIIFKQMLLKKENNNEEYLYFKKNCIKLNELTTLSNTLSKRFSLDSLSMHNSSLIVQLIGVSNSLRKYAIDIVSKKELDAKVIFEIKKDILNFGYDLTYIEVIKPFDDDYVIEIGIHKEEENEVINNLTKIINNVLKERVSVIFQKKDQDISYFKIVPEIKINIQYGFGTLSANNNNICGDNYIIKETCNGKFITAISDGMGSGFNAFKESNETLNLVSTVLEQNLEASTAIEILNTYYAIQEYLERYSTLDLLEINRHTKLAKFFKMGATTSYIIKHNGTINKIYNQNLPFGIEDYVDNKEYILEDNDLILMSSDGIFENLVGNEQLDEFIKKIRGNTPQKIVYEILQYTMNNKIKVKDDATLIALKVKTT
ncbi:MAG: SpoIIE family protein phosphatase [Bacilli bacterium]|nr:SpoIIE family protein phosphatase [Bacilli bacterium]